LNTIDRPQPSERKPLKRGDSIVGKMQIKEKVQINPIVASILQEALQQSRRANSNILSQNVEKARKDREKRVYIREMARDEEEYLHEAGKATQVQSSYLQMGLESTVNGIIDQISKEIEICDMPIRLKRKVLNLLLRNFKTLRKSGSRRC
jgi:hydroxylamine reductase (hybrid-cluster protein)